MPYLSLLLFSMSLILFSLSNLSLFFNYTIYLNFPLTPLSSMNLHISLIMDWMSLTFSASVLIISSAIVLFSFSYIPLKEQKRFSLILLLFIMSMIILIFSNNIFFIILGWDGLGLSSYILVIYYFNNKASESGTLTILSNRVGDISIILAICFISSLGSWEFFLSKNFPFLPLILLLMAAFSKSAQSPFSAWLPAAMAAPTPISALVHSSTLVTAGTFLMIRTMNLNHPISMFIILLASTSTLFFSGLSANWEQDMKKIIALSTLSQIAIMMFAISINSYNTAFFHLITHAMFKSTIFLCAGAIIHGSHYQDMRKHGASCNNSPILMVSLGICSLALMGLPFLSGYFSKDMIIETFMKNTLNSFVIIIMLFSIGLTSSYSSRMLIFSSKPILKSPKDISFNFDIWMFTSITFMTPISIFLGASMMWSLYPYQLFIIPSFTKISSLIIIMMGLLCGLNLSFKSKQFIILGESSISLWFLHFISCSPPLTILKKSSLIWTLDKSWLEMSSANGLFLLMKKMSKSPDLFLNLSLMAISMFVSSTIIMISLYLFSYFMSALLKMKKPLISILK